MKLSIVINKSLEVAYMYKAHLGALILKINNRTLLYSNECSIKKVISPINIKIIKET
jgi:hypothetical protein